VISFFIRGKSFSWVCPFDFYDICKKVRVGSGCVTGKITQVLANDVLTAGIYKNESYVR